MIRQDSKTNKGKQKHARAWRSALIIAALAMGGVLSAQTCTPVAPPYTESFNAAVTPALPTCMSIETISGNPWTTVVAPAGYTGKIAQVSYTAGGSPIMNSWLYTKGVVLTGGTSYRVAYKYGNNSTGYAESMSVAYGTAASAVSMTNSLADYPTINDNMPHAAFVDFTPSSTATYYIGFKCYSIADQYYLYLDDISVTITPTCFPPTAVTVSNISSTSADLSWTDNASGSYNYEVRSSGAAGSGPVGLAVSGTVASGTPAINITPLNAGTTYAAYVQGSCSGGSDLSAWTDASNFTTQCAVAIAPYLENFDAALSTPNCWTNTATGTTMWLFSTSGGTGPNYGVANSVDHTSGTGYFAWFDGSFVPSVPTLTSPLIDITPLTQALVSVWVKSNNVDDAAQNTLKIQAYNGTAWVDLISYAQNDPAWVNVTVGVPASIPSPAQFRMVIIASTAGSAFYNDILVDDFEVLEAPTCLAPTALAASNITLTSADLTWTASLSGPTNGYQWELRTSGAAGSGPTGLTDSGITGAGITTASTSLLTANTTYTLYVRTDCGSGGFSAWASAPSFMTGYCTPAGNNTSYYINDFSTTGGFQNITNTGTGYSSNGYGDYPGQVVSQSAEGVVNFNAVFGSGTNTFHFRIWVDWNNDFSFDGANELMFDGTVYQTSYAGSFTVPTGTAAGNYRMRIRNTYTGTPLPCGTSNGETEDYTFTAGAPPSCQTPTNLGTSNVIVTTADLSWTASPSAPSNGYQWEVRTSGVGGSGSTGLVDNGTTAAGVVTASTSLLTANTNYTLYVRSDCGAGDFSNWSSSPSFHTQCTVEIAPYLENFDAALVTPDCWTNTATAGTLWLLSASLGTGPNYGVAGSVDHTTGTGNFAWFDGSYVPSVPTLTSPLIDITPLTQAMVSVWVKSNNTNDAAQNTLKVQAYNGTTWVDLISYAQNAASWVNLYAGVPSSIPSPAQFRMVIIASTVGSAFYNDILVDDFQVIESPSCLPPSNVAASNMTYTSADLSWTASLSTPADGYQWEVRSSGNPGSGASGLADNGATATAVTNASTSALISDTDYMIYVRSVCGSGDTSAWSSPADFHTGYCAASNSGTGTYFSNFVTTGGGSNISNPTGDSPNGYGNYTSMEVSQSAGLMVNFATTLVGGSAGTAIWVDWNNDMAFTSGEQVFVTSAYGYNQTGTITVPAGTPNGSYRMRIMCDYLNASPSSACGAATSGGEVEDYTFTVGPPPSCQTPTNLAASNMTLTTADLSWTASPSAPSNGYQWEVRTSGAGGSGASGLIDSGTTGAGVVTASTSLLTANTTYTLYVRGDCGAGDFSNWSSSPSFYTGYCTPDGNNVSYYINDFSTTDGFLNITNTGTGYSNTGYGDYTGQVVSQADGGTVTFNAVFGSGTNTFHFRIWVDWNNDYAFDDATELMFDGTVYQTNYTGSFTVPTGTAQGDYRMRIRNTYTGTPLSCGTSNGETEDYILEVIDPALIDCEGVYNGPAMPGTACTANNGFPGVWGDDCTCVVTDCEGVANGPALPGTPCLSTPNGWGGIWNLSCACIENVGVDEIAGTTGFSIYPNPASSILYITTPNDAPVHVKIYDMVGTLVIDKDMVHQLDITKLATGSYTLVATDAKGGNERHARFMKQ